MTEEEVFERVDALLADKPYRAQHKLPIFKALIRNAARKNAQYRKYVEQWAIPIDEAEQLWQLPYLPVSLFKTDHVPVLAPPEQIFRTMLSSATTGTQPSRIPLDRATAKRMTKGTLSIIADFIGPQRRPYLVIDVDTTNAPSAQLTARAAAIRGLQPFASEVHYFLSGEIDYQLQLDKLTKVANELAGSEVLIYGFTFLIWSKLVQPLRQQGISLGLDKARVVHSGGWKKLVSESVDKDRFNQEVSQIIGCPPSHVIDYYGMVENLGVIYPDCEFGNKHVPAFADVCIRSPLTLRPVAEGETGIVQVSSMLPGSFPGYCLLTEDLGQVISYENCPCGRKGLAFRFAGRIPKAELRGCGDVIAHRYNAATTP